MKKNKRGKKRLTHSSGVSRTSYDKATTGTTRSVAQLRAELKKQFQIHDRAADLHLEAAVKIAAAISQLGEKDPRGRKTRRVK